MKLFKWICWLLIVCSGGALAQQVVKKTQTPLQPGNEVRHVLGIIEGDSVEIEGITIINGEVSIDGVKIPRGTRKYRSPKSGKSYLIEWGHGNNVSVAEQ